MVGKLLGGESKETRPLLTQSRDRYLQYTKKLEAGRFMNGIRVVRTLILDRVKCSPTSLNQCPVGMESLKGRRGVGMLKIKLINYLSKKKNKVKKRTDFCDICAAGEKMVKKYEAARRNEDTSLVQILKLRSAVNEFQVHKKLALEQGRKFKYLISKLSVVISTGNHKYQTSASALYGHHGIHVKEYPKDKGGDAKRHRSVS
ncbi:hypothetical protein BB560_004859 [Smittium megazygosporum]|uniref:Uncharacterized protein n=1 Tax=Smittium megazygosporum TaxID=133381 RepID=A0A2T9Z890_9FUNG|nr:hypothetical protein BB560_004859 [Smittium megazygosporum]